MGETDPSNEIMTAVGYALSTWAGVELQLCSLFAVVSDIPDSRKARVIFDGVISFEVRLAILDHAMAFEDTDPVETEMWARMSARLTKFYRKRHQLAHFSLITTEDPYTAAISPFLTMSRWTEGKQSRLKVAEIRERDTKFRLIFEALFWFIQRAKQRRSIPTPEPGLQSVERHGLVPQLRELAVQNLAKLGTQPQP